jgi:hypothetical protein
MCQMMANESLLKSIYGTDTLSLDLKSAAISKHVERAFGQHFVVPKGLLLATGKFNIDSATKELKKQPIVRKVMQEIIGK